MRRRTFLAAAGIGGLVGAAVNGLQAKPAAAVQTCDMGNCIPPPYTPSTPFDLAHVGKIQKAAPCNAKERPLWSRMAPLQRKKYRGDLQAAYCAMTGKKGTDGKLSPFSMAGQAWLHQYYCCPDMDPEGSIFPKGVREIHQTADFLAWHRAFLYFHERVIQALLKDADFRLPVWDWEAPSGAVTPWIYDAMPFVSDAKTSPLCPRAKRVDDITELMLKSWLFVDDFTNPSTGPDGYPTPSMAAQGPHGTVHTQLAGYMSRTPAAAFDPIFYAHHGNVDRFWEYWRKRVAKDPDRVPPGPYYFFDAWPDPDQPRVVCVNPHELLNTAELGYGYEPPKLSPMGLGETLVSHSNPEDLITFAKPPLDELSRLLGLAKSLARAFPAEPAALSEVVRPLALPALRIEVPAAVEFTAGAVEPGKSYAIRAADALGTHLFTIGSFANFTAGGTGARRFIAPLDLSTDDLLGLVALAEAGGFSLFYCEIQAGGQLNNPLPLDAKTVVFRLRIP